jgi:hypothetical protein
MRWPSLVCLATLTYPQACSANRRLEDCEACGLIVWRMQAIVAAKEMELESLKKAKEKRAKASTKAHSKRWLKQEYGVELAAAIESHIGELPRDRRIYGGACQTGPGAVIDSALRQRESSHFHPGECERRVQSRASDVLEEFQDELIEAVLSGHSAGTACANTLPSCAPSRAKVLLGSQYKDAMSYNELESLSIGQRDGYVMHTDVDVCFAPGHLPATCGLTDQSADPQSPRLTQGSKYWYSTVAMHSTREPPPGWVKNGDEWEFDSTYDGPLYPVDAKRAPAHLAKDEV